MRRHAEERRRKNNLKKREENKENNSLIDSFKLSISLQKDPLIISFIHSYRYGRVKGQGHMSVKVSKLFGGEKQIYTHAYMLETPKSPKKQLQQFFFFFFLKSSHMFKLVFALSPGGGGRKQVRNGLPSRRSLKGSTMLY